MEIRSFRYRAGRPAPKRSALKRALLAGAASILLLTTGGYTYVAAHKPLEPLKVTLQQSVTLPAETVSLPWPGSGQAAIGSLEEGVLGVSGQDNTPRPIASITKVITALAVMKQKPFKDGGQGAALTLDASDVALYNSYVARGGAVVAVADGEQLTQYQALEAMLLPSGNNMADSLASWAFGSVEAYVSYANAMLKEMGLTRTTIADASGFSTATVSTPSELILIGRKVLADPVLKKIVAEKEAVIPVAGTVTNTNRLLPDKAVGIKTGHTDEAGWCLLFASYVDGGNDGDATVIGAVTGQSSSGALYAAAESLLATTKTGFKTREVLKAGQVVGSYTSAWGQSGDISSQQSLSTYGWRGRELHADLTVSLNTSTITAGSDVGEAAVNGQAVDLIARQTIPPPSLWWRLRHYF